MTTKADKHVESAKKHIDDAVCDLLAATNIKTEGANDYNSLFKEKLEAVLIELRRIRRQDLIN